MRSVRLVVSVVVGLFAVGLFAAGTLGLSGPSDGEAAAELESLRSAPECGSEPTEPAACTWEGEFEFVGSDRHRGHRGPDWYSIDLREAGLDPDGSPGFVHAVEEFDREDVEGLTYGMPVTATVWRGRIIGVRIDGRALPTSDYPDVPPEPTGRMTTGQGAVVVVLLAAFVVVGGLLPYVRGRRGRAAARSGVAGD